MKGKGEIPHRADLAAEKLQMWIRRIIEAKLDLSCGPPMCAYICVNSVNVPETVPEVSEPGLYFRVYVVTVDSQPISTPCLDH